MLRESRTLSVPTGGENALNETEGLLFEPTLTTSPLIIKLWLDASQKQTNTQIEL